MSFSTVCRFSRINNKCLIDILPWGDGNVKGNENQKQKRILPYNVFLHAFCLMDNHVHMMISEGEEDIAKVMKRITVSYVYYFNKKYKRTGHLFQDRFLELEDSCYYRT